MVKLIIASPLICLLQFFVFIGIVSEKICEEIEGWIYG
nr:MAG TPA: hypothetical protein [Caudoviricetes sp.]